jgi:hypothetical protein
LLFSSLIIAVSDRKPKEYFGGTTQFFLNYLPLNPSAMRMQIFALLFFAPLLVNSQSVSPSVIASAGGSSTLSNGISIDWTLGEFAVTTLTNGSITLTQGFHQPNLEASVSYEDPTFGYAIRAWRPSFRTN